MDTDSERDRSSEPNLQTSSDNHTYRDNENDDVDGDSSTPEYKKNMRDEDYGDLTDIEDCGTSDAEGVGVEKIKKGKSKEVEEDDDDDDDDDIAGHDEKSCLLVPETKKIKTSRRSRSRQRIKRRVQQTPEREEKLNTLKLSKLRGNKEKRVKKCAETSTTDEDEVKVLLKQKEFEEKQQERQKVRETRTHEQRSSDAEAGGPIEVNTIKLIKIRGNLRDNSANSDTEEEEANIEEPYQSFESTTIYTTTKTTNETVSVELNNAVEANNPSNIAWDALQVPTAAEIDAEQTVELEELRDCAVPITELECLNEKLFEKIITTTTITKLLQEHEEHEGEEEEEEEEINVEKLAKNVTHEEQCCRDQRDQTTVNRKEKSEPNCKVNKCEGELVCSLAQCATVTQRQEEEEDNASKCAQDNNTPTNKNSTNTTTTTTTTVNNILTDEENWRDSVRESIECYYSAQDLLEYGHLLSSGLKTPDIESGYFEKSESDISRDETEVYTNTTNTNTNLNNTTNSLRKRQLTKSHSNANTKNTTTTTQLKNMSESLRFELDRFKTMIESIERERIYGQTNETKQTTFGTVLEAEKSYDADMEAEVAEAADAVAETVSITVTGADVGGASAMDIDVGDADMDVKGAVGGGESGVDDATNAAEADDDDDARGYWSTIFGQASQIEETAREMTLDERFADIQKAHRALELLEDYHSRLSEPQDRALRIAIERVIRIFKSRLFQALLARDFMQAYRLQSQCIQSVVKMLQLLKEENWCLSIMYTTCLDLRILAQKCEELGSSSKPGEILEKAADCLMSCFRVCAADNRSSDDDTKRLGMLNLVNQLFKVYFRINKLHLCKPLIRAIDSSTFKDSFPLPEQITYKYFVGRKAMFDSDYKSADEFLSFALRNCPRNFPRNKRLILIYLVPVKMLLGYMPKKDNLERFDLLQFHELAVALKEGNVRKFDEVIQRHEIFFIKCGIYLLVEKLKFIVYRNLFKRVYIIKKTHQLDLRAFQAALQFVGETDMSLDETHCIVANLIFEGKIKGYISHSHNKLVVSKQNPFPPLNTVS